MAKEPDLRTAVDIGGTFTDTVLMTPTGDVLATCKTPTTSDNPTLGALEGVERALNDAGAAYSQITGFIHGTTLATNALIERQGARVATITNEGFRDILEIVRSRYETLETLDMGALNAFFDAMISEAEDVVRAGSPDGALDCLHALSRSRA